MSKWFLDTDTSILLILDEQGYIVAKINKTADNITACRELMRVHNQDFQNLYEGYYYET